MTIIRRKPQNSSLRFQTFVGYEDLNKKDPERSLVKGLRKHGGRNTYGRITVRHRGGGARRLYRIIDFNRTERDMPGKIIAVEYDPNRNVRIGLVIFPSGRKRYVLMPQGLSVGSILEAGDAVEARVGNCLPLRSIPVGFVVHNVEMQPGSGGKLARSAGTSIQLVAREDNYAKLKMPSGEVRMVHENCMATIGVLGNADHKNISVGKAGRTRRMGIRPTVRGVVMNPIDHPLGGGEGKSKSGKPPQSPWGKNAKGAKTRRRKSSLILKRRK